MLSLWHPPQGFGPDTLRHIRATGHDFILLARTFPARRSFWLDAARRRYATAARALLDYIACYGSGSKLERLADARRRFGFPEDRPHA